MNTYARVLPSLSLAELYLILPCSRANCSHLSCRHRPPVSRRRRQEAFRNQTAASAAALPMLVQRSFIKKWRWVTSVWAVFVGSAVAKRTCASNEPVIVCARRGFGFGGLLGHAVHGLCRWIAGLSRQTVSCAAEVGPGQVGGQFSNIAAWLAAGRE